MDQGFLVLFLGHLIVNLGYDFNRVRGWKVQHSLPDSAQTVNAGNRASGFGTFAPDAKHELGNHMEQLQLFGYLVYLLLDFGRFEVFYGHSLIFTLQSDLHFVG